MRLLRHMHNEFSNRFSSNGDVWIAGGAIRDVVLARKPKDYDIFVAADLDEDEVAGRCDDLSSIKSRPSHIYEPFLKGTFMYQDHIVQIMSTPCRSIDQLLDTFDWNVSLFGFNGEIVKRIDADDIAAGKTLKLQKVTYPWSTLRRGFRFSERFEMKFANEDIAMLCGLIDKDWKSNLKTEALV